MDIENPWSLFNSDEQSAIASKLKKETTKLPNGKTRTETNQEAFNRLVGGGSNEDIANRVAGVKTLIYDLGGTSNSDVWQQVSNVEQVFLDSSSKSVAFNLTVNDATKFTDALGKNGFTVNGFTEIAKYFEPLAHGNLKIGEPHKNSARFVTDTSAEISPHLVQESYYPSTRFDMHWDPESSSCRSCTLGDKIRAGKAHAHPFSGIQVWTRDRKPAIK